MNILIWLLNMGKIIKIYIEEIIEKIDIEEILNSKFKLLIIFIILRFGKIKKKYIKENIIVFFF